LGVRDSPLPLDDVQLLDTTLRDGEQAPGVSLSPDQKADLARLLDEAGVGFVEAGSACTSEGEREAIRRVTDLDLDATVTSFCRGLQTDLDLALSCDVDGVNLVVPASDRHVEQKVGKTREEVVETTVELVEYARDHGLWVEVLGEDGSRSDLDYLERLMGAALDAGAHRVCYCDTVGHAGPERTYEAVSRLADLGPTSTHTHDDLGLGVTNALGSVAAGADLVHATVNGVGERAGNVALEEVAVALWHCYDAPPVDVERLYELSRAVADATGVQLPPNKAVCGANAFAHESGIHTDGTLKDDRMYEPYQPSAVGRERRLVVGKHAGRAGVEAALAEHGVELDADELGEVVERVKDLGERGHRVTDADLLALAEDARGDRDRVVSIEELTVSCGSGTPAASLRLSVRGERHVGAATGTGPVDAAVETVREALSELDFRLESYRADAVTGGTDAVVTVEVELSGNDRTVVAAASDADVTLASVTAVVDGVDRLLSASVETGSAETGESAADD